MLGRPASVNQRLTSVGTSLAYSAVELSHDTNRGCEGEP